jgi:hypothetical protein
MRVRTIQGTIREEAKLMVQETVRMAGQVIMDRMADLLPDRMPTRMPTRMEDRMEDRMDLVGPAQYREEELEDHSVVRAARKTPAVTATAAIRVVTAATALLEVVVVVWELEVSTIVAEVAEVVEREREGVAPLLLVLSSKHRLENPAAAAVARQLPALFQGL